MCQPTARMRQASASGDASAQLSALERKLGSAGLLLPFPPFLCSDAELQAAGSPGIAEPAGARRRTASVPLCVLALGGRAQEGF